MKINKEKILNTLKNNLDKILIGLLILYVFGISFGIIYVDYRRDKDEYLEKYNKYSSMTNELVNNIITINTLQDEEERYEDDLYDGMVRYYNETDDEVIKYVFENRFPSPQEYENDRKSAFVVIYAMLELYPEIKEDKVINECLLGIDDTLGELKELVKSHNENVDECNNLKDEINELKYIKIWNKKCRINIEIRKVLFLEE